MSEWRLMDMEWNGSDENGRNVPLYGLNNYRFFTVYCIRVN